jgi:hypothetical protein
MPEAQKKLLRGRKAADEHQQQRRKRDKVVTPPPPDEQHEHGGENYKNLYLISGQLPYSPFIAPIVLYQALFNPDFTDEKSG